MSRIGKLPIKLPQGVEVKVSPRNEVSVKGPKGELKQPVNQDITVKVADGLVIVERPTEQKRHKAMHGLYRALIANMVKGVTEGFKIRLELVGVGYRAAATGQQVEIGIGFSHPIIFVAPPEVKIATETAKGQNPAIILESFDKQLVGQVAAKIRAIRGPEPYKGKGIKYSHEVIRRKAGKVVAST